MKMASNVEVKSVHLDEILKKFGPLSRYHLRTFSLIGFAFFINGMHCVNFMFVAEDLPYRCKIDQCEQDKAFEAPWYNFTAPPEYRHCSKYVSVVDIGCSPINFNATAVERCSEWIYEHKNSFVSEFQLACQDWKRTFVGTVHGIGLMIGLAFQGQLSDKIGRKAAIVIAGVAAAVFGLAKSFATTYSTFIVLELLEATFGDNCSPAYIMRKYFCIELVHSDYRIHKHIFIGVFFAMGAVTMSIVAYFVQYWRNFVQAIYAPSLLFLFYYFLMDESVRWLLSKGKKDKATNIIKKIAKINHIKLEDNILPNIQFVQKKTESSPLWNTIRSKIVFKRFLVCIVWWISCTFISFGLTINVMSLAGDKYINFGLMSLTDIPVTFAMLYILKKFRRQKPLLVSFMTSGAVCLIQPFAPRELVWLSTGLYLLGRFVTSFAFTTVYLYTSELFPTYTRNSLHSLCSAIGRIGSILAPMTPLLTQYMESLPTLLIGGISIFAGLTTLLVPDIADETLPDNVQQAELMGIQVTANTKSKDAH